AFRAGDGGYELRPDSAEDFEALAQALGEVPARILALWALDPAVADLAFDGAYLLARMLQMADAGQGCRLLLAATGSAGAGDTPVTAPRGAMLLGLVRVGPREIPGLGAVLVDLAADAAPAAAARALLEEAGPGDAADHVAL